MKKGFSLTPKKNKDLFQQLSQNPNVEFCFYDPEDPRQVRVSGEVELLEDRNVKEKVLEKLPFLKKLVDKEGLDILAPHCLKHGKASVWTRESAFDEKHSIEL